MKSTTPKIYIISQVLFQYYRGVTFHSLLGTCCKITHCWQNLLVTYCRSFSLQKVTFYSLPSSLVSRYRTCSWQKLIHSLLVAEIACYKKSHVKFVAKFSRYSLPNSLVTRCRNHSLFVAGIARSTKSFVTCLRRYDKIAVRIVLRIFL